MGHQGSAERIARVGGELARDLGARVVLAHVRRDPRPSNSSTQRERARHRSPRELEVVKLIAEGFTSEEIAEQLFISKKTVDTPPSAQACR